MSRERAYALLCGSVGVVLALIGVGLFAAFLGFSAPGGRSPLPLDAYGTYFAAFAGCALIGWGGALIGAARQPASSRTTGTASALALSLAGVYRMIAWMLGDVPLFADVLRAEAAVFLLLALAFVWLRPARPAPEAA